MKHLLLLVLTGLSISAFAKSEKPQTTSSKITNVIIYLSGAQVERNAQVTIEKGTTTLLFDDLSNTIDENSIQIAGLGQSSILSINYGVNYLKEVENSEEIEDLNLERTSLNLQIQKIENRIRGLEKEEEVLNNNQHLGSSTQAIDLAQVKTHAAYYRTRMTEIRDEMLELQIEKQELQDQDNRILKQLDDKTVITEKSTGQIIVKLTSDLTTTLDLKISYNVSQAGWYPEYDLKTTNTQSPLELSYKAHVYQKTGINWDDVQLILSTGDPNTNNTKPDVNTKYLNFVSSNYSNNSNPIKAYSAKYNPNIRTVSGIVSDENGPLPGATVMVSGTSKEIQTDFDGYYSLEVGVGEKLSYDFTGYQPEVLPILSSVMNVTLAISKELNEVIVTAHGIKREKKALGYAVSNVRSRDMERALTGKAVGVTSQSGASGSATNVVIRGYNSIDGSNQALFIVDGVPYSNDSSGFTPANTNSSRFLDIDPDNIANVEVLKGLAASTLYGTAGRNGVIVITTKRGFNKKTTTATGTIKSDGITTTTFEIPQPYSIISDGDITVIKVDEITVPATYEHFSAPLLNENVFLTASIENWAQYNLLPGEANIYFEGSFSGKTFIDPFETSKTLLVSLGIDPGVVIERKEIERFKSKSLIGTQRIVDFGYDLIVKNTKSTPVNLKLLDRVPISQNKEIKVDEIETSDAVYNEETGLIRWNITIKPSEKATKNFGYQIKFPKYKTINL